MSETRTVDLSGGALDVHVCGAGAPALVFLHYWGGSHRTFELVVASLESEATAITFDQRGWGASRRLAGPYGIEQLADDVLDVVRCLGLARYVLVGHSMGGKVALVVASRRPAGLARLVLVAPAPPKPAVDHDTARRRSHAYDDEASVRETVRRALASRPLRDDLLQRVVEDSLACNQDARTAWPLEGLLADITVACGSIEVPVLVVAGQQDLVDPPESLASNLMPYVRTAEMVVIEAGHLSPLEAPTHVAAQIDRFLGRVR